MRATRKTLTFLVMVTLIFSLVPSVIASYNIADLADKNKEAEKLSNSLFSQKSSLAVLDKKSASSPRLTIKNLQNPQLSLSPQREEAKQNIQKFIASVEKSENPQLAVMPREEQMRVAFNEFRRKEKEKLENSEPKIVYGIVPVNPGAAAGVLPQLGQAGAFLQGAGASLAATLGLIQAVNPLGAIAIKDNFQATDLSAENVMVQKPASLHSLAHITTEVNDLPLGSVTKPSNLKLTFLEGIRNPSKLKNILQKEEVRPLSWHEQDISGILKSSEDKKGKVEDMIKKEEITGEVGTLAEFSLIRDNRIVGEAKIRFPNNALSSIPMKKAVISSLGVTEEATRYLDREAQEGILSQLLQAQLREVKKRDIPVVETSLATSELEKLRLMEKLIERVELETTLIRGFTSLEEPTKGTFWIGIYPRN